MAHENRRQLEQLLSVLDHEKNDIYLQVDSKGTLNTDNLATCESSLFILPSLPVYWAGFSQIRAELRLLKAASKHNYHYYHLITNSDLPIVNQCTIHNFLENSDLEYIDFSTDHSFAHFKAAYYHIFLENKLYLKSAIVRGLRHFIVKSQSTLGIDRSKKTNTVYYRGSAYFSITHNLAEYILMKERWITYLFHHTLACDEVFLQTLVMESPFKSKLSDSKGHKTMNLRYIDWGRRNNNSPYTFRMADYEELKKASKQAFFARKFNIAVDQQIVDTIVDKIINQGSL